MPEIHCAKTAKLALPSNTLTCDGLCIFPLHHLRLTDHT